MTSRNIEVRHETVSTEGSSQATLKFGISTPLREGDKGELVLLPPDQPLSFAIAQVCQTWGFPDPSIFGLKINDRYVTEENRKELSGKLVVMHHSPFKVCTEILDKLKYPNTMELGLKELSQKASDPTLAEVFVSQVDGLQVLIEILEKDKLVDKEKALAYLLEALLDIIINSCNATWDKLQPTVISKIVSTVNSHTRGPQERPALRPALQVLESAVASGHAYSQVEREVPLATLIQHIQNPEPKVQQNAMALLNAILSKAEHSKRKHLASTLTSRKYRDIIIQYVIKKPNESRPAETNRQLFVLQTYFLNFLDERKHMPVDPQDQESLNRIKDLAKIAFDSDGGAFTFGSNFELNGNNTAKREKPNLSRDYKKLGFQNDINPAQDFCETPPGILALDCMHYLATTHTEVYNKLVLETVCRGAGDECPFARASIALTKVLCDIFRIGEPPGDQQGKFYPFIFQHERPFEEFFCICAQLVTKTWKEMRATAEDFDKVFDVVQEQISRGLAAIGVSIQESLQFTELKAELFQRLTYADISNLRAQERCSREEGELQAKPIQELRNALKPEMLELIKQNRLNYMINGTRFNRYTSKGLGLVRVKEKFWFCRLSPNGKIIHYGDCEEKATPLPEELSSKVSVVDLQDLLVGKDCPHGKKKNPLAFSLVTERDPLQSIDFVAPDDKTFDLWTDGINALLGKSMNSKEAKGDLEILLSMEIKLRLLDIEGIPEIPMEPPPIPELPPNFDFFSNVK